MQRILSKRRFYSKLVSCEGAPIPVGCGDKRPQINFKQLTNASKVPARPVAENYFAVAASGTSIDSQTVQLLERLSLVDLDSKAALATLQSGIQFAERIAHIDTTAVQPLYTVLEEQHLALRDDRISEGNCREEILRNARVTDEDYFVSPPGNIPLEQEEKDFTV